MGPNDDFRDLLELFNANQVDFVIVGSLALAWHGHPRYTGDIDLFVKPDSENANRILKALGEFGFGQLGLENRDFVEPERVVQLGVPPNRVDIVNSLTGVSWDQTILGAVEGSYSGVPVKYIGKDEYIVNKRAMGRHKDLADIEAIQGLGQDPQSEDEG